MYIHTYILYLSQSEYTYPLVNEYKNNGIYSDDMAKRRATVYTLLHHILHFVYACCIGLCSPLQNSIHVVSLQHVLFVDEIMYTVRCNLVMLNANTHAV